MPSKKKPPQARYRMVFGVRVEYQQALKELADKHGVDKATMVEMLIDRARKVEG